MKNEQGSEPLWRRACLWTYCERIAVQNIKDMRLNLKLRLLAFGIFVVTPVLYATGSNKAKSGNFCRYRIVLSKHSLQ